ncbi:unnamed protein product [Linum trigynum]|uniref:Uncharacterized protein n=1 Tax=Linum trigynum TaxID=586398 RepID=A0AAV2CFE5_9ROSI
MTIIIYFHLFLMADDVVSLLSSHRALLPSSLLFPLSGRYSCRAEERDGREIAVELGRREEGWPDAFVERPGIDRSLASVGLAAALARMEGNGR